ncbi:hypothetical protein GCM10025794_36700 [Massilia kyonggiensis]
MDVISLIVAMAAGLDTSDLAAIRGNTRRMVTGADGAAAGNSTVRCHA